MRLIDADALLNDSEIKANFDSLDVVYINLIVEEQPTVDPVKHARWIKHDCPDGSSRLYCSHCGYIDETTHEYRYDFCPTCGAKMHSDRPPKGKWRLLKGKWTCSECGNKTGWPLKTCNNCEREMKIEI